MKAQLLTKHSGLFHISFISTALGAIMNALFLFMSKVFHVENVAMVIILFTVVIYLVLTPLTYQQQKFAILQSRMNPELQLVQGKYKGKNDQESMMRMREEQKFVYAKYGVTTLGSCLMPLINIMILFNLLFVIYSIPAYIAPVGEALRPLAENLSANDTAVKLMSELAEGIKTYTKPNFSGFAEMAADKKINTVIDALYQFGPQAWEKLQSAFPAISLNIAGTAVSDAVGHTAGIIGGMTDFFGINISDTPMNLIKGGMYGALAFPILAALTQFINFKLMPQQNSNNEQANSMMRSMKTMNYIMPIFSAWFCLSFPVGISIYWIVGPVIRSIQQIFTNIHIKKINVDELIEKNLAKINEKRAKEGLPPVRDVTALHNSSGKKGTGTGYVMTEDSKKRAETARKKTNLDSSAYYQKEAKEGSLAAKARMVERLNKKED